jgi:prolyl-tRNA editing enzyme YbaK/EbsC (Cys-tRNA(Pro) deacylase)
VLLSDFVTASLGAVATPFELIACDPEFADTAAFCDRYGYPLSKSANTLVVVSRRGPDVVAACVVAADTRLDVNQTVRRTLGVSKMSFAGPDETKALTGMELGGVTVFGLPSTIALLVDESLLDLDYVILGAGTRSAKVKAAPSILTELPGVQVLAGLAKPASR